MPRIRASTIEEHKDLTRREILAAAKERFLDDGYATTSFADIAATVGIGRTTLYEYFPDKEALIVALVCSELPDILTRMVEGLPRASHEVRLRTLVQRLVRFFASDTDIGALLHRDVPQLSAAGQARITEAHQALIDQMLHIYQLGVAAEEFRSLPPATAGHIMRGVALCAVHSLSDAADVEGASTALVDFLIRGIAAD